MAIVPAIKKAAPISDITIPPAKNMLIPPLSLIIPYFMKFITGGEKNRIRNYF